MGCAAANYTVDFYRARQHYNPEDHTPFIQVCSAIWVVLSKVLVSSLALNYTNVIVI
jgi:hypothetical protein